MTTSLIGGHALGLNDTSWQLLNRTDRSNQGSTGHGLATFANVANGNLIVREVDTILPSRGADFELVRTYNSRGKLKDIDKGWTLSTGVQLSSHQDKPANNGPAVTNYSAVWGDGSESHFVFSAGTRWVSTDGAGAFETLDVLARAATDGASFVLTRANQTQYRFDKNFRLLASVDTNGVRMDFIYQGSKLAQVRDDTGHVVTFNYDNAGSVTSVSDESGVTLVRYAYAQGRLASVTDRFGHVTQYSYDTSSGMLVRIALPSTQSVNGVLQAYETRELRFDYMRVDWDDHPHAATAFDEGQVYVVKAITDALGGVTTFDYAFTFSNTLAPSDRDIAFKATGGAYFTGGTTKVIDSLGNARATSNAAEYVAWRTANGFYATYSAAVVAGSATLTAQYNAIRNAQSLTYSYDADGYITQVVDQQGYQTTYTYDAKDNLTSIVDRNGNAAISSDAQYFRDLRKDLGFVDLAGNGKLAASLTAAEKTAILAKFTTRFTYDANGNLLTRTDNAGNVTTWTYTTFNKVASELSAVGTALTTSDDAFYQAKRVELGFPATVASLSAAQKTSLRTLYTTSFTYDAKQNLTRITSAGGDVTNFEYDAFGNLTKRTVVYRDAANVAVPAKDQVTQFFYDAFGNNNKTIDAEGATTLRTFDHFGNLLTSIDGRGGVTTNTYDADNRLLSTTDPEGHVTAHAYDAVGNRISTTDASGHTVTFVFDRNDMLVATIDPAANPALSRSTTFKYDILGNRTEMTDAEGRKTSYVFDARRQMVSVTTDKVLNASEQLVSYTSTYAYDGESNIVTQRDNNGNTTQLLYTTTNLLKRTTDPIGNVTEYLYDANLMQVQVTIGAQLAPALRRVLKFSRDEENQVVSQTDALGKVSRVAYDAPGNVVSMTDENGNKTDFEFDRKNRLIKETLPAVLNASGQSVRYTILHLYDANGNEISTTDQNGKVTTVAFDKDDRAVMVTDANGIKTVYTWDSRDNRTQVAIGVDAQLDATGKVVITSTAQAAVTSFVYDEFNQLVATTDGVGNALVSSNDALYQDIRAELGFARQLASLTAADKTNLLNRFTDRYEYDRVGNQVKMTDHLGRVSTMSYDALNRMQSSTQAAGTPVARTLQMRYDGNGNLVKGTDSLGRVARFSFDGNDRLVDETAPDGVITRNTYDNVGNVLSVTRAFGTTDARKTTYVYDLNDRLTLETDPENHTRQYEYDAVGNRLKMTDGRLGVTQYVYDSLNRNIKIIDPKSFQTRYEYDGVGNRITIIDPNGGIERMQYDAGNRYIQTTDPEGRVTRLEYDRLGHVITQTTAFGTPQAQVTRFVYDAEDNLRKVIDAEGKESTQGFDAVYNLTRSTDGNGHTTTTIFDARNRRIQSTDALGQTSSWTYDTESNQLTETDELGRTRTFTYDSRDRKITQTDARGVQTTYGYDLVGNQVRITHAANKPGEARTTTFVYDGDDRLIRQVDALNQETKYEYDANDNVTKTTDALGRATLYTYDARNQLTKITDPLGHETKYEYDGNGNRVRVTDARNNAQTMYYNADNEMVLKVDAEGNVQKRTYDANGNLTSVTYFMTPVAGVPSLTVQPTVTPNAKDRTTRYEYDRLNRMVKQTDAESGVSLMTYDAVGNRLTYTDENGHLTRYAYDDLDRLVKVTDPLLGERSYTYDAVGNRKSETDENGRKRSFDYDEENRLVKETDPRNATRSYVYDSVDNLLSQTDENGHTTSFTYDLVDRMLTQTDPRGGVKRYTYDAVGNRKSVTDENTFVTEFFYDGDDRLIEQRDPLGFSRFYNYDAVDNLIEEIDENGHSTTYAYDRNDRRIRSTDSLGGVREMAYDAVGNTLSVKDENGHTTRYEYDRNDRLVKQTDPRGGTRTYTYDAVGNRKTETDENTHTTSFFYDDNDRLVRRVDARGGERKYGFDAAGNQIKATDEKGFDTLFEYDENNRLTKITDALNGVRRFGYDAVGNRTSEIDQTGALTQFVYDENNRLSKRIDALNKTREFGYDAVGNQTSVLDENSHTTRFTYDANRRITKRTDALGHEQKFAYDGVGNLRVSTDENGHATNFSYDENNRLTGQVDAEGHLTSFTYDAAGNQKTVVDANGHQTAYDYDENDRLIARTDAKNKKREFTYDAAGNRITEKDENGGITTFDYDALDRITVRTDALGYKKFFTYDARGSLVRTEERRSLTNPADLAVTRSAFDELGRLKSILSAEGYLTVYEYDGVGRRTQQTQYDNRVLPTATDGAPITASGPSRITKASYDANGRLSTETDAVGVVTRYEYDGVGNMTAKVEADGTAKSRRSEIAYDAADRAIDATDASGVITHSVLDAAGNVLELYEAWQTPDQRVTKFTYDDVNRVETQTDALGYKSEMLYDGVGNLLSRRSAIGTVDERTESYEYDELNRQSAEVNGQGDRTEYAYDGVGNRVGVTLAKGKPEQRLSSMRYDLDNRLIAEVDGNGIETQHRYDGMGNRIETIQFTAAYDAAGNPLISYKLLPVAGNSRHTFFEYDRDNRLTAVVDPMGGRTTYEYDVLGNQTRIVDPLGRETINGYDATGRLTSNLIKGTFHGGVLVTNTYDAFGNVVDTRKSFADNSGMRRTTYAYDALDRQTEITEYDLVPQWTSAMVFKQAFSSTIGYDAFGNQTALTYGLYLLEAGDAGYDATKAALAHPLAATMGYDKLDRLTSATDGVGNVVAYTNDAHGNRTSQTTGDGTTDARTVVFAYDRADRLVRRETDDGGVVTMAYDKAGNQTSKAFLQRGVEGGVGPDAPVWATTIYEYDGNGRVMKETDPLNTVTDHVLDAFGNEVLTRLAAGTTDQRELVSEYNANNDLIGEVDAMGFGSEYTVDAVGNRIREKDALGRLTYLYYNESNEQIGTLDAEGFLTTFDRDAEGNVTATRVYMNRYDVPADPTQAPVPAAGDPERTTRLEYDGANNRVKEIAADGAVTDYLYDSARKLLQVTRHAAPDAQRLGRTADASDRMIKYGYDTAGRLTRFENVDGTLVKYEYDTANNKTREEMSNPNVLATGQSDPVRVTVYRYDAANRQISQTFDPDGLALTETLTYDKAGNVVRKTDARNNATTSTYDLNGQLLSATDALGNTTSFTYDRVGNQTSLTDARGNRSDFEYDKNNRLVRELLPAVDVFTIAGGLQVGVRPETITKYDKAGNVIQVIDAAGFKTTSYYDRNDNKVAEINGDNVLRRFEYDATGALTSATLYMRPLAADAHDPATKPGSPSGEARTVTSTYDAAGRLLRKRYGEAMLTTLSGVNGGIPVATEAKRAVEEVNYYDAFGNLVESLDKNGNRSLAYYDKLGRVIAAVDAAGYLVETDFDDQNNVVRQRSYAQALDIGSLSAGVRSAAPGGQVAQIDRLYDAANRLIVEDSPSVKIGEDNGAPVFARVRTTWRYDANGNQISRSVADGTTDAAIEHYYYDALNRRVGVVTALGTLNTFAYDANGNRTQQSRFYQRVAASVNLQTATFNDVVNSITVDDSRDEITDNTYDVLNRLTRQTDRMGPGTADDIVTETAYDGVGNATRRVDGEGYVSQLAHDSGGRITQTLTPNGAASFVEYNAAGQKVRAWTGGLPNTAAQQATDVTATAGDGITIRWNQPGSSAQSWVVWDTQKRSVPDGSTPADVYQFETARVGSGASSATIPLNGLQPGDRVYFRVVSQDAAGNIAWTEERELSVPAGMDALSVQQVGSDIVVRTHFGAAVTGVKLHYGSNSNLDTSVDFVQQPDGSYRAVIANPSNPQALSFRIEWTAAGETINSDPIALEATGVHKAVGTTVAIALPTVGGQPIGSGQLVLVDGVRNAATRVVDQLQFDPQLTTNGTHRYDVFYGNLAAADHSAKLSSRADQSTVQDGADTIARDKDDNVTSVTRHMKWVQTYSTDVEVTLGAGEVPNGPVRVAYKAKGSGIDFSADVSLTASNGKYTGTLALDPGDYDIKISYVDAAGKEVIVEWRSITVSAATLPASFDVVDDTSPFDFVGQESELNLAATVADPAGVRTFTGKSLTVLASETDGEIRRQGNSPLQVDAGLYQGPLEPAGSSSSLDATPTDSSGAGALSSDGLVSKTYYTEVRYDSLGSKIATNEDSGVWRTFGVDANGNALVTRTFGTEDDEAAFIRGEAGHDPVLRYAVYDARDNQVMDFAPATAVEGAVGQQHGITRTTYDFAGRVESVQQAGDSAATHYEYDGVGNVIALTDAMGHTVRRAYDRRGNTTLEVDALGNSSAIAYDAENNVVSQTNALGKTTTFTYDAFGRAIAQTDPLGHATTMDYDQHDRLTTVTDALGNTSTRYYDKRDKQTWLQDANGHWFGSAYDPMGLLTHEYSFFEFGPGSLADAQDALDGNNFFHDQLIDVSSEYDIFGNRVVKTDANGNREFFTYGAFGRLTDRSVEDANGGGFIAFSTRTEYDRFGGVSAQTSTQGQDITRQYDAVGRLIEIDDQGTGVRTTYSYHLNGERATERIYRFGQLVRDMAYTYDENNRLVRWQDGVSGKQLNYVFDAAGYLSQVHTDNFSLSHTYTHYADGRIASFNKGEGLNTFTYDDAGNRVEWDEAGNIHTYVYDDADRVIQESSGGGARSWSYDNVGNILQFVDENGEATTNTYIANYLVTQIVSGNRTTQTTFDKASRQLEQTIDNGGTTSQFTFSYNADGTLDTITGTGSGASGSSQSFYDVNQKLTELNLGQGDGQDRPEVRQFTYNNDGQILSRFADDGRTQQVLTEFLYAMGNPVAEYDDQGNMVIDEGKYDPVKIISADFPAGLAVDYVVRTGDTLQSIAGQIYGNPSLWFVIAEANGLSGAETLREGMHLKIPNTTQNGSITAETHALYQEGEIVGSKLPNLKSPPPPQTAQSAQGGNNCAVIAAIILTVVVAIVAIALTIVTAGVLAPLAAAAIGATSTLAVAAVTIAVGAVAGAVIGFAASAATQGIQIGLGLKEEFDWKQVAIDTVAGFVGGAFGGIAQVASTALKAAQLGVTAFRIARVGIALAEAAGEVAIEAASQAAANEGRIEEPWMLAASAAGVAVGELLTRGVRVIRNAVKSSRAAAKAVKDAAEAGAQAGKRVRFTDANEVISSKPLSQVTLKPKDTTTSLKASDTALVPVSSSGQLSIKLTDAGSVFDDAGKKRGWSVFKTFRTAAAALSMVNSANPLSRAPDFKTLMAVNKLAVGAVKNMNKETITAFAGGSAGRIRNNVVPLAALPSPGSVTPKLELSADAIVKQWNVKGDVTSAAIKRVTPEADVSDSLDMLRRQGMLNDQRDAMALMKPLKAADEAKPENIVVDNVMKADDGVVAKADDAPIASDDTSAPALDAAESSPVTSSSDPRFNGLPMDQKAAIRRAEAAAFKHRVQADKQARLDWELKGRMGRSDIDVRLDVGTKASSRKAKRAMQKYFKQSQKPWGSTPEARRAQFAGMQAHLNKALADDNVGALAQKELTLLNDTVSDSAIINSDLVANPTHAMELKRFGLQPTLSARIDKFTDTRLIGKMKYLGGGNIGTVSLGKYKLPDGETFHGVFKAEVRSWNAKAGDASGIDPINPLTGNRSVASSRLDEALGFNIMTRAEFGMHDGKLGTVSELARGVSMQGDLAISNTEMPIDQARSIMDNHDELSFVDYYNSLKPKHQIAAKEVNGEIRYFELHHQYRDPNFYDPRLRRDLVRLQLMDAISGQVDRHPGNYFVLQNAKGEVVGVKAIDNDQSWGRLFKDLSGKTRIDGAHNPDYLPPVVDKEAYDSIMNLTRKDLEDRLGNLLRTEEIDAAASRLKQVQDHLTKLKGKDRVIEHLYQWSSSRVEALLLKPKDGGQKYTSYFLRDLDTFNEKARLGESVPYPRNKMAN